MIYKVETRTADYSDTIEAPNLAEARSMFEAMGYEIEATLDTHTFVISSHHRPQCPWCGNPVEEAILHYDVVGYERVMEAHVSECVDFLREIGEEV